MECKRKSNKLLIFLLIKSIVEISSLHWHNKYAYDIFNCAVIINIFSFIVIFMLDKDSIINEKININIKEKIDYNYLPDFIKQEYLIIEELHAQDDMEIEKLSKRLEAVATLVDVGKRVIDVGCDHAYLDIYLTLNNENKC